MIEKKILVAYFSRADENYNVGYIKEGNTEILAGMIADETGADIFHIETVEPYPADYNECIELAKKELRAKARPAIKGDVAVEDYDMIFIGTPDWWAAPPMAIYTFIEKHNWQGKTIAVFETNEGSGMGGLDRDIAQACKGAKMLKGFAIEGHVAQNQREEVRVAINDWLRQMEF